MHNTTHASASVRQQGTYVHLNGMDEHLKSAIEIAGLQHYGVYDQGPDRVDYFTTSKTALETQPPPGQFWRQWDTITGVHPEGKHMQGNADLDDGQIQLSNQMAGLVALQGKRECHGHWKERQRRDDQAPA